MQRRTGCNDLFYLIHDDQCLIYAADGTHDCIVPCDTACDLRPFHGIKCRCHCHRHTCHRLYVFKTLVTKGASGAYYVFDIPVAENLDLKKAAKAVGEKSIAMLPQKELLPLTGYVHGGCSPVGMKKQFPTVFHETVNDLELVAVSAGKIGHQVQVKPDDLLNLLRAKTADVVV